MSKICAKCVLDSLTPKTNLVFDELGVCNNCYAYKEAAQKTILRDKDVIEVELNEIIAKIKSDGLGKEYDCILGISGGIDSTYLAYLAKEKGLKPLVVHFDNGWNSELAVQNICNTINTLNLDLNTYVINWNEFSDLQLSYIKASVIDIEIPTDQFIYATLNEIAYKHRIRYILDGNNVSTEFPGGSWKWTFNKLDLVNLRNIHKKFGSVKLKKFPKLGFYHRFFYSYIYGVKNVYLLNYVNYERNQVIKIISEKLNWKDYGGKHFESIFTRFYQGYILPKKFHVDKRKAHLSNLIWSNQITREEALEILKTEPYPHQMQQDDLKYVCKKLNISEGEFLEYFKRPIVSHEYYGTEDDKLQKIKHKLFLFVFRIPIIFRFTKLLIRLRII